MGRILFLSGQSVYRTCDSLRFVREEGGIECDLTNPRLIRCTDLRKYIATTMQVQHYFIVKMYATHINCKKTGILITITLCPMLIRIV